LVIVPVRTTDTVYPRLAGFTVFFPLAVSIAPDIEPVRVIVEEKLDPDFCPNITAFDTSALVTLVGKMFKPGIFTNDIVLQPYRTMAIRAAP